MEINFRPYQSQSLDSLRLGFKDGHARQVLAASTGSGKSIIALGMIESAKNKGSRVMFVCDRRVLVDQFSRHLDRHGIDHGVFMAGHWRYRPSEKIQVASIQTLEKMQEWPLVDLIIVDEIHAVMRKSLKRFMDNNPARKVLGLTATPYQPDLPSYFSNVVNVITMKELVSNKYLVPFRVFIAKEIDTTGVKITGGEWQKDELEQRGLQVVGDVVSDYIKISQSVFGGYKKTICFSSGVAHGIALARQFEENGLKFIPISYLDDEDFKKDVLEEFAKPDTDINGIISSEILTRGFDQTDVEHVIVAKPLRKSFSMHVQIVGRGARPHQGKDFCVVQDNSGNWLRFLEDWEQLYEEGTKDLGQNKDEKPRKEPTEKEKKEAKCPACGALWPRGSDTCAHCGHVRERKSMVQSVPGEMQELGSMSRDDKQKWWSMAQYKVQTGSWSDKRALANYREKFGVWPRGLSDAPLPPTRAFESFAIKSIRKYLKGQR
jgi:DNA repair protein RadD